MTSAVEQKQNKVALVTGSTCGIGLTIANVLAQHGCDLIITGLASQEEVDQIKHDISEKHNVKVDFVGGDLRKVADINAMVENIFKLYENGVDILINNAGFQHVCLIENYPEDKWDDMVSIMLSAPFHLIKRLSPAMKKQGWGRIVNISSQMGMISTPGKTAYSAMKSGLIGLTKGVALELAEHGITCNAVCPTFALTELIEKQIIDNMKKNNTSYEEEMTVLCNLVPVKKLITVEQIADFVQYLCFSEASPLMTGSAYLLDGGYTAQ